MNILIIGGAGFIGSHLCSYYISTGNNVVSLDNYISGSPCNHIDGVEYLNMDAIDINNIQNNFDLIFHLGEYSRVEKSLKKVDFVLHNNLDPTFENIRFL